MFVKIPHNILSGSYTTGQNISDRRDIRMHPRNLVSFTWRMSLSLLSQERAKTAHECPEIFQDSCPEEINCIPRESANALAS
jgi:hypothetical protein